jgi:hypothetical protein
MHRGMLFAAMLLGAFGLAACSSHHLGRRELRPRPKLFVGHHVGNTWTPLWDNAKDIWQSCPEAALIWNREDADYQLIMSWSDGHWSARLLRSDFAYLLQKDSPDFNRILRDSCKALRYDALEWLAPPKIGKAAEEPTDRYELRELRNGAVSTSAMIDKKTGKVWIWTNLTDNNGKKTGKSAFLSEEVIPEPEK